MNTITESTERAKTRVLFFPLDDLLIILDIFTVLFGAFH